MDLCDDFPTHKPFIVDIRLAKLKQILKNPRPVTNYATLLGDMIQKKTDAARTQADEVEEQQGEAHAKVTVDEHLIRCTVTKALHDAMDVQQSDRRLSAIFHWNTGQLWQLATAAIEDANINFHCLE